MQWNAVHFYLGLTNEPWIDMDCSNVGTACTFDISLYLTPLVQARQFIETCGT